MWLILSLLALLCWSGSDIFSKVGSKQNDNLSHWKMVIAVGLVMGIHAFIEIVFFGVTITFNDIVSYLPASALYIFSMVIGYIGLRYIELSVSSPICNSSGALASLFLIVFFFCNGESEGGINTVFAIIGVLVCGFGVVGLGIVEAKEDEELKVLRQKDANRKYAKSMLAILLPLLYCLIDAGGTVADSFILENMDENVANVAYELTFLFMAVISAVYVYLIKREKIERKSDGLKVVAGVSETLGQVAYVFAISSNAVYSAPIISCYCALSVVWGRIFLKEKMSKWHYLMIFITLIGIAVLGVFGE